VFTIVTSVPGIGTQNAVCLMVYTDNFRRFNYDSRKISCYYGIAPFGKDSGTSVHSDPHVHYMANRQIKAMLTQASLAAVKFNPIMARYYMRLVERGKKKQVALNNVKNKLIHLVTAMVRNRQLFSPEYKISA
ncbi:MAG: IS110 family transposase, partial [Prevotella sp.]|nr:IS110 family transposase [Prevotella sp.]